MAHGLEIGYDTSKRFLEHEALLILHRWVYLFWSAQLDTHSPDGQGI